MAFLLASKSSEEPGACGARSNPWWRGQPSIDLGIEGRVRAERNKVPLKWESTAVVGFTPAVLLAGAYDVYLQRGKVYG